MTKLFCSKPFEWFEVTQLNGRGGVYLCCPSWLAVPVGNLLQEPVAAIWNSPRAQEIRAVLEVTERRGRGHAHGARDLTDLHGLVALGLHHVERRLDQRTSQVPVVVRDLLGLFAGGARHAGEIAQAALHIDVIGVYISM